MNQQRERKHRPVDLTSAETHHFDLAALASDLLKSEATQRSGQVAQTLVRNDAMTLVLTVMKAGVKLGEHKAEAPVAVTVLGGNVVFTAGAGHKEYDLRAGSALAFPAAMPHSARAVEDSSFLIVIGGQHE